MSAHQPEPSAGDANPGRQQPTPAAGQSQVAGLAAEYAAKAGLHRTHDGKVDVLRSAGGAQGIAESIVPGLVFLVAFTITRELTLS
ncbi:MAG: DUF3159 domain-containing protein, partial [Actinomycetes bacterium]